MKRKLTKFLITFLISGLSVWGLFVVLSTHARANNLDSLTSAVTVAGTWSGVEQDSFQSVLDEFTFRTGFSNSYTQSNDINNFLLNCSSSGTCPDVAVVSLPGILDALVEQGTLVPLDLIVSNFDTYYTTTWRSLASIDGTLYAIPFRASSKSMIWYRPAAFESISATVPTSWSALLDLSDDLVASDQTPFSIGAKSGEASGWPLSDWFENILLRVGGPNVHQKLVQHKIAWTDPLVVESMERFNDIFGNNEYQAGGVTGTLNTDFYDAINIVFGSSPTATMYAQGSWVGGEIGNRFPGLVPGDDYNYFDFPEINPVFGKPLLGAADFIVLLHDTPEARMLIQFLASPDAAEVWLALGSHGYLSPNLGVELNSYPDILTRAQAIQLREAGGFIFDLDDQLPHELQHYIWNALMEYVAHPGLMMTILEGIERKATEYQGAPYDIFIPAVMNSSG
jgi:alpha-glucoside transport system substrate-binding protein